MSHNRIIYQNKWLFVTTHGVLASCSTSCADVLQECQKVSAVERAPDGDLKGL